MSPGHRDNQNVEPHSNERRATTQYPPRPHTSCENHNVRLSRSFPIVAVTQPALPAILSRSPGVVPLMVPWRRPLYTTLLYSCNRTSCFPSKNRHSYEFSFICIDTSWFFPSYSHNATSGTNGRSHRTLASESLQRISFTTALFRRGLPGITGR